MIHVGLEKGKLADAPGLGIKVADRDALPPFMGSPGHVPGNQKIHITALADPKDPDRVVTVGAARIGFFRQLKGKDPDKL